MTISARGYVVRKAEDVQRKSREVTERARSVTDPGIDVPAGAITAGEDARNAVTRLASDARARARAASSHAAQEFADQLRGVSELAAVLATTGARLEDRESGARVLSEIYDQIDRLHKQYEADLAEVGRLAEDTIGDFAATNLVAKETLARRAAEADEIAEFIGGAMQELRERFVAEGERRGVSDQIRRALDFLDFDIEFSRRVGTMEGYRRELAAPVDAMETRLSRLASEPGFYESLVSDLEGVYSRDELDDLNRRLDEVAR